MSLMLFNEIMRDFSALLDDDYLNEYSFKINLKTNPYLTVNSENTFKYKTKIETTGKLSFKVNTNTDFMIDNIDLSARGLDLLKVSCAELAPGLKLEFQGKGNGETEGGFEFRQPSMSLNGKLDMTNFARSKIEGLFSHLGLLVGASLTSNPRLKDDTKYDLGFRFTTRYGAIGALTSNNLSKLTIGSLFKFNEEVSFGARIESLIDGSEKKITMGYAYIPQSNLKTKAKLDSKFNFTSSINYTFVKGIQLTLSIQTNTLLMTSPVTGIRLNFGY